MRYLKIFVCLVILSPILVKGAVCDNATRVRLQNIAQNVTYSYDYKEINNSVTFDITFRNLNNEIYLVDSKSNQRFDYTGTDLVIGGYKSGVNYKFEVRSADILCDSSSLYYIYVTTPDYNPYYNDPICNGLDYKYCKKWQKNTLTYDEFVKNVNEYRKSLENNPNNPDNIKGIFDYIIEFYLRWYFIILPTVIIISITTIVIYNKKNNLF